MRKKLVLTVLIGLLVIDHLVFAEIIGGSSEVSPPPFWEDSFWGMTTSIERAFAFTTPSGGPYIVEELEVAAYHYEGMAGSTAYFSINADNAGEPGDVQALAELTGITTSQQVLSVDFADELILSSDTSYWLVGGTNQGQVNWNLGDMAFGTAAYRVDEGEWTILSGANVSAFAILGSPVPEPATILLFGLGALVLRRKHR